MNDLKETHSTSTARPLAAYSVGTPVDNTVSGVGDEALQCISGRKTGCPVSSILRIRDTVASLKELEVS
jgi:hypothetical protein